MHFFQETNNAAVGQVYELNLDGTICVYWADKTRSRIRPHELFLPGDDVSNNIYINTTCSPC